MRYRSLFIDGANEENEYIGNLESDVQALKNAAEANSFTQDQIKSYVEGLLKMKQKLFHIRL